VVRIIPNSDIYCPAIHPLSPGQITAWITMRSYAEVHGHPRSSVSVPIIEARMRLRMCHY